MMSYKKIFSNMSVNFFFKMKLYQKNARSVVNTYSVNVARTVRYRSQICIGFVRRATVCVCMELCNGMKRMK